MEEQSTCSEADNSSAGQEIPPFMKPEESLPSSQHSATGPYPMPAESSSSRKILFI